MSDPFDRFIQQERKKSEIRLQFLANKEAITPEGTVRASKSSEVAQSTLWRVIGEFFSGSPKRLMAHLVQDEQIDETELAEIRKMLRSGEEGEEKKK